MPPSSLAHEPAVAVLSATFLSGSLSRDTLDDVLGFVSSMNGKAPAGRGGGGGGTHEAFADLPSPSLRAELDAFLTSYDETAPFSDVRTLLATALCSDEPTFLAFLAEGPLLALTRRHLGVTHDADATLRDIALLCPTPFFARALRLLVRHQLEASPSPTWTHSEWTVLERLVEVDGGVAFDRDAAVRAVRHGFRSKLATRYTFRRTLLWLCAALRVDEHPSADPTLRGATFHFDHVLRLSVHGRLEEQGACALVRRNPLRALHAPHLLAALPNLVRWGAVDAAFVAYAGTTLLVRLAREAEPSVLLALAAHSDEMREALRAQWPAYVLHVAAKGGSDGPEAEADAARPPTTSHECPITCEPCVDPVLASDGHTYERHAILTHMVHNGAKSPLTRETLDTLVVPNRALCEQRPA